MALHTFYFHPIGLDGNGNGGPNVFSKGWVVIVAETDNQFDYDAAYNVAPDWVKDHITYEMVQFRGSEKREHPCSQCTDPKCRSLSHFIADTAAWGIGFTILGEEDWKNWLDGSEVKSC